MACRIMLPHTPPKTCTYWSPRHSEYGISQDKMGIKVTKKLI